MTDVAQFPSGRTGTGRRWGKAGVPLTRREAQERDQATGRERLRNQQRLNIAAKFGIVAAEGEPPRGVDWRRP